MIEIQVPTKLLEYFKNKSELARIIGCQVASKRLKSIYSLLLSNEYQLQIITKTLESMAEYSIDDDELIPFEPDYQLRNCIPSLCF